MPWISLACAVLVAACGFDANYAGGHYTCSDGVCPTGLSCVAGACVMAGGDGPTEQPAIDAREPALTCADPGMLPGSVTGDTGIRSNMNLMTASCGGAVMNGKDAVYKVAAAASQHIMVMVTGNFPAKAYVLSACTPAPATPTCLGGSYASDGSPISVATTTAGDYVVVVDCDLAADSGAYSLTVSVGP